MRITREHPPGPSAILGHFGNVGWGLDCAPQQPRPFQLSDPCRTERTPLQNGVRNYTTVSHHQNRTPRGGARTIPAPRRQRQEHRPEFKASLCPLYRNLYPSRKQKQKQTKPKIPTQVLSHRPRPGLAWRSTGSVSHQRPGPRQNLTRQELAPPGEPRNQSRETSPGRGALPRTTARGCAGALGARSPRGSPPRLSL